MSRPQRPWFRFYTETCDDLKLRQLPPAQRWVWVTVLTAARQSPQPGRLLVSTGRPMPIVLLADKAAVPVRVVVAALAEFVRDDMVYCDGDVWVVTHWEQRQYESDDVTQRTRKHRAMERPQERDGNVPGTPSERFEERFGNIPETETDTDTEKPPLKTCSSDDERPVTEAFDVWWRRYPRKVGKAKARTAYRAALTKRGVTAPRLAEGLTASIAAWQREHRSTSLIPHATTWLREERWDDDYGADRPSVPKSVQGISNWLEMSEAKERPNGQTGLGPPVGGSVERLPDVGAGRDGRRDVAPIGVHDAGGGRG